MPTRPEILGFGNEWCQPALDAAVVVALPSGRRIRMVAAPYFLATKITAFGSRGQGDYVTSHDMEDIVAVFDGRPEIINELKQTDDALQKHLAVQFSALLRDTNFLVALPGHLPGDAASQARVSLVMERITEIAKGR